MKGEERRGTKKMKKSLIAKAYNIYHKAKEAADTIIALQLYPKKWSTAQLKTILTPLKIKSDGAMPTKKGTIGSLTALEGQSQTIV